MTTEYETKILDIDKDFIIAKLQEIGAEYIDTYSMRRWVYDLSKLESGGNHWVRLRDNGEKVTLTYKLREGSEIGQTGEIETVVESFEAAAAILEKIEFKRRFYQENKRALYKLEDIEFTIDEWPMIPPLLEVEAKSIDQVEKGLGLLGMQEKAVGDISMVRVYQRYGIDVHSIPELKFSDTSTY